MADGSTFSPAGSLHAWRDDALSAADADAATRSMREWLELLADADIYGGLAPAQHAEALAELDQYGRVWSAAVAAESADEAAYVAEQAIVRAMRTQGLSACPITQAA